MLQGLRGPHTYHGARNGIMIAQDRNQSRTAVAQNSAVGRVSVFRRVKLPAVLKIYLFCVIIPIGFNLGPLLMTSLRGFLIIVTLPLLFGIVSGKYGRLLISDIFFLLYVFWMAITLASNNPQDVVQQVGSVGIEFLGGYALGRAYIRSREDYLELCRALIVIACLLVPFALVETITGTPNIIMLLKSIPGMITVPIVSYEPRMGLERVQASFAHPIHFGLFCSIIFSQAFVALRGQMSDGARYVLSAVISATGFLALSSGALLSIILQFGLVVWAFLFRSSQHRWWILLGFFVAAYIFVDAASNRTPILVFMSYATFSAETAYYRALIFEWGMQNIWANPIMGIGMNDWFRPAYMNSPSVDNFWLWIAMQFGIPGFFILASGFLVPIWRIMFRRIVGDAALANIRLAWVFTFLGLTFTLTTVAIWTNIYSFVFFMFGAGMWMCPPRSSAAKPEQARLGALPVSPLRQGLGTAAPQVARGAPQMGVPQPLVGTGRYSRFAPKSVRSGTASDAPE